MIVTVLAPSVPYPSGGVLSLYEFAGGLRRRGHEVHLAHVEFLGTSVSSLDDLHWFDFDPGLVHHFGHDATRRDLPPADVVLGFDRRVLDLEGLPAVFVQAYRILPDEIESAIYHAPCPKICISRWLLEVAANLGVPRNELVYVPYGLRHDVYRTIVPLDERPPRVSMLFSRHPVKASGLGFEALELAKSRLPRLESVVYGVSAPSPKILPRWAECVVDPPRDVLVREVYNQSRVFIWPSLLEGFGFPPIEAMACGDALVVTNNGGSDDYAVAGQTALVCEPEDVAAMADHVVTLMTDDEQCRRIACGGQEYVRRYDWDESARQLEEFIVRYRRDPEAFIGAGRPG